MVSDGDLHNLVKLDLPKTFKFRTLPVIDRRPMPNHCMIFGVALFLSFDLVHISRSTLFIRVRKVRDGVAVGRRGLNVIIVQIRIFLQNEFHCKKIHICYKEEFRLNRAKRGTITYLSYPIKLKDTSRNLKLTKIR